MSFGWDGTAMGEAGAVWLRFFTGRERGGFG
jgi:hypothetical protein